MLAELRAERSTGPQAYYDEHGYVVMPQLVPARQIDALLELYRTHIHPSKAKFYRQNTSEYDTNRYNAGGHVMQSFLDIHNYKKFPEFREAALQLYFSDPMLGALSGLTGHAAHHLMQSMFFDANATTWPHQDWWYLDTVPAGNLIAAWIALEDIREEAGRFYVMPGTQRKVLHREGLTHSAWVEEIRRYKDAHPEQVETPALRKGDVLFWNSGTIHGSHPTQDVRFSRKSLTAHYMPSDLTFGNLFTAKPWVRYESYRGHKYFANQPEHSLKAEAVSRFKVAVYDSPRILKLVRKIQRRSIADL